MHMEEIIFINGQPHISTQRASDVLGYDSDYIARFCRRGRIAATFWNGRWMINVEALRVFVDQHAEQKALSQFRLSQELTNLPHTPKVLPVDRRREGDDEVPRCNCAPRDMWKLEVTRSAAHTPPSLVTWAIYAGAMTTVIVLTAGISSILQSPQTFARVNDVRALIAAAGGATDESALLANTARYVYKHVSKIVCLTLPWCGSDASLVYQRESLSDEQLITAAARKRALTPLVITERAHTPPPTTIVKQPIIERVVERVTTAAGSYATVGVFEKMLVKELVAQNVFADTIDARKTTTKELCLDDICITKVELRELLDLRAQSAAVSESLPVASTIPAAPIEPVNAPESVSSPESVYSEDSVATPDPLPA